MADILIRGMEMPKTCQICRTAKFDRIVGCEEWDRLSIAQRMYMRSETCPLIPLPEGHGRLGDLDALAERCDSPHWCVWLNEIQDAPTIIEADLEWKMKNCCCFSNTDQAEGGGEDG